MFESALDGLVFALVEDVDKVFDGFAACFEFLAAFDEDAALFCEVLPLLEGFLVDAGVFFEGVVDFAETLLCLSFILLVLHVHRGDEKRAKGPHT